VHKFTAVVYRSIAAGLLLPGMLVQQALAASRDGIDGRPRSGSVAPTDPRGMDFSVYIRLQIGMSEGELLLRAGKPDSAAVENLSGVAIKTYYYYPTLADPWITTITLRGGKIISLDRVKKIF
jgi:hypothetical protein